MAKAPATAMSPPPGEEEKDEKKSPRNKKRAGTSVLLMVFGSLALIVLIKHSFIFIMIALMPSIIGYLIDPHSRKSRYRIIRNFNIAGMLPAAVALLQQGNTVSAVQSTLSNPYVWAMMYGSALIGFLLVWLAPAVYYIVLEITSASQIKRLESAQKSLIEEWGQEVSGKAEASDI